MFIKEKMTKRDYVLLKRFKWWHEDRENHVLNHDEESYIKVYMGLLYPKKPFHRNKEPGHVEDPTDPNENGELLKRAS